jgi:hypothetical protein
MRVQVAFAVLFLASFVSANSGIFGDDGKVVPTAVERSADVKAIKRGLEKKETNFERMRRGLPPLRPARMSPPYKRTFLDRISCRG